MYDFKKVKKDIPTKLHTSIEAFKTQLLFNNLERIEREVDGLLTMEIERLPDHLGTHFIKPLLYLFLRMSFTNVE